MKWTQFVGTASFIEKRKRSTRNHTTKSSVVAVQNQTYSGHQTRVAVDYRAPRNITGVLALSRLIYDLSDGSSLHVTSAIWLTPNRHQIQGQGLRPDVHILSGDGPNE